MTEPSEQDLDRADIIVRGMFDDEPVADEVADGLIVFDVEADVDRFRGESEFLEAYGLPFPAVRVGTAEYQEAGPVPVSLNLLLDNSGYSEGYQLGIPGWYFENFHRAVAKSAIAQETISTGQARQTFLGRARAFLATRIAAISNTGWATELLRLPPRLGMRPIHTPGCNFEVSTNTPNLRVFWSGAYYISPNYFSAPTTPASGPLQSGIYLFGVDGGPYGSNLQWDINAVTTLPGQPKVHLNF